jgi:hypothetical protein
MVLQPRSAFLAGEWIKILSARIAEFAGGLVREDR